MADEIVVNHQYLQNASTDCRALAQDLEGFLELPGDSLDSAPAVARSYRALSSRWDKRRSDLAAALDAMADGFIKASAAFDEVDTRFADAAAGD